MESQNSSNSPGRSFKASSPVGKKGTDSALSRGSTAGMSKSLKPKKKRSNTRDYEDDMGSEEF